MDEVFIRSAECPIDLPDHILLATAGDKGHKFVVNNRQGENLYYASQKSMKDPLDIQVFPSQLNIVDHTGQKVMSICQDENDKDINILDGNMATFGSIESEPNCCGGLKETVKDESMQVVLEIIPKFCGVLKTFSVMSQIEPEGRKVGKILISLRGRNSKEFGYECEPNLTDQMKLLILAATFYQAYNLNGGSYITQFGL